MAENIEELFRNKQYKKVRKILQRSKDPVSLSIIAKTYINETDYVNAEKFLKKALNKDPYNIVVLTEIAGLLFIQGKTSASISHFKKIAELEPNIETYNNLALSYVKLGDFDNAESTFLAASNLEPNNISLLKNICKFYIDQNALEKAESIAEKVNQDLLYYSIAFSYDNQKNYEQAIRLNEKAIEINPSCFLAYNNLGSIYIKNNLLDKSEECYLKALEINPKYALCYTNIGNIAKYKGDIDKAHEYYLKAIELGDNSDNVYSNIGVILTEQRKISEGIEFYKKALTKNPHNQEVIFNYSLSLLLLGDFANGFLLYESRKNTLNYTRNPQHEWAGQKDEVVVILAEQGFGDIIQFCRFIPMVKVISKKVILVCPKSLFPLMEEFVDELIESEDEVRLPAGSKFIHMMSLPNIFKTTLETIPCNEKYLFVKKDKINYWKERMNGSGLKIGLVWAGNPRKFSISSSSVDVKRSMVLQNYEPLLDINATFFNLQKDQETSEYPQIINLMNDVEDFSDTAAIIENLDLVISVDTSIIHLAGALGKPVWMLSRFDGCWRWLINREDSPWYKTLRIFQQPSPGDWESVVSNIKTELVMLQK